MTRITTALLTALLLASGGAASAQLLMVLGVLEYWRDLSPAERRDRKALLSPRELVYLETNLAHAAVLHRRARGLAANPFEDVTLELAVP